MRRGEDLVCQPILAVIPKKEPKLRDRLMFSLHIDRNSLVKTKRSEPTIVGRITGNPEVGMCDHINANGLCAGKFDCLPLNGKINTILQNKIGRSTEGMTSDDVLFFAAKKSLDEKII